MNIIRALGEDISNWAKAWAAELGRREAAHRRRRLSEADEVGDDHGMHHEAPRSRRSNTAHALLAAIGNPDMPHGLPVAGRLSSAFGLREHPILRGVRAHNGEDIAAPAGSDVATTAGGIVTHAGPRGTYGNLVEIDHGNGFVTRYAHLESIAVSVGERVARGTTIGAVGQTGRATGPHLHYEVLAHGRFQNPSHYMRAQQGHAER